MEHKYGKLSSVTVKIILFGGGGNIWLLYVALLEKIIIPYTIFCVWEIIYPNLPPVLKGF